MHKLKRILKLFYWSFFPHPVKKYLDQSANSLKCIYCYGDDQKPIQLKDNRNIPSELSDNLFSDERSLEKEENFSNPGLYRFFQLPKVSRQYLVGIKTLDQALNCFGYLWQYGNLDDCRRFEDKIKILNQRPLILACTNQSKIACHLFKEMGIEARLISCMTAEQWNGQDDGHTMVEVKNEKGNWSVYDPSFQRYFPDISIVDLCVNHDLLKNSILLPGNNGNGGFQSSGYDYALWVNALLASPDYFQSWEKRIFQVPLIHCGKKYNFSDHHKLDIDRERFLSIYNYVPEQEFNKKFYKTK